jgi:hypothetical protein
MIDLDAYTIDEESEAEGLTRAVQNIEYELEMLRRGDSQTGGINDAVTMLARIAKALEDIAGELYLMRVDKD